MSNVYLINTDTLQWPIYEGELNILFPNTSFPVPLVTPPMPYSWVEASIQPSYDWITQGIREITPVLQDTVWVQSWEVYQLTPEEVAANEQQARENNKRTATAFLQQTDWTAPASIADPVESNPYLANRAAFLNYRSQVRDIALNPPVTVTTWPTLPDEQWAYNQ